MKLRSLMPTVALAVGIAISTAAKLPWWLGIGFIVLAATCYIIILNKSGNPVKALKAGNWHIAWIAVLFCGIGMTDEYINRPLTLQEAFGAELPTFVTGEITNILPKTYGDRIEIEIYNTNGAKAQIRTGATALSAGEIITLPSRYLKEIALDTAEVAMKTAPMLLSKGVLYSGFVPVKLISEEGTTHSFKSFCTDIRNQIEIRIERSHLKKETSDFIKAILMGDKTGLNEETRLTFANGGIAHMLALSGLHMGILASMMLWIMWPARAFGKYKWSYAIAIALLWIYVCVTGLSHSSVRACIMISFAFVAIIMERKNSVAHALCSACLLILLINPSALFDAGFQLSVVCVASLIAFASRMNPMRHRQHPRLYRICEALLATMVATAASWAFISYYFGQVPLMFLPTNLLLLPLIPVYLGMSVVFTLLLCFGVEFHLLGVILERGYDFMLWAADTLSAGGDYIISYQIPLCGLLAWILLLSVSAYALHR